MKYTISGTNKDCASTIRTECGYAICLDWSYESIYFKKKDSFEWIVYKYSIYSKYTHLDINNVERFLFNQLYSYLYSHLYNPKTIEVNKSLSMLYKKITM